MELRDLLADIHALEEELLAFERKYGIRSEIFYHAYVSGEGCDRSIPTTYAACCSG